MKLIISIIWVLSFCVCVQAAESTKVEQLMKQEFKDCLNAQSNAAETYDGLKDKNLGTYNELPQVKVYRGALLTMIDRCEKVGAFHKDAEQGREIEQLVSEAIADLEKNNNMRK